MRDSRISTTVFGAALAVLLIHPGLLENAEWRSYDWLSSMAPDVRPSGQVIVVALDETSLDRYGRWPWPRDVLGVLIEKTLAAGARVVVLDAMFPEPDRSPPGLPTPTAEGMAKGPSNDTVMAEAMAKGRVVVGYQFTSREVKGQGDCILHPLAMLRTTGPGEGPGRLLNARGTICSVAAIAGAATGSGFLDAAPDSDGILRRIPLLMEHKDRTYPSLALAARMAAGNQGQLQIDGARTVLFDGRRMPVDEHGQLLVRFRTGSEGVARISAGEIMADRAGKAAVAGKIAVIGGTAAGLQSTLATPGDAMMAGVDVQATVIDNLFAGDFVERPAGWAFWQAGLLLFCAAGTAWVTGRLGAVLGSAAVFLGLASLWVMATLVLWSGRTFLSPLLATATIAATYAGICISYQRRQRARTENAERELTTMRRFTLSALTAMSEAHDGETANHARRLQRYMTLLCEGLRGHPRFAEFLRPPMVELLVELTPVHDIGKVGIPDSVLRKDGPLTSAEFAIVKGHVEHGRTILETAYRESRMQNVRLFEQACSIVTAHHERWDGTGYPYGLNGEEIPIPARMLAVADVYDALVSRRVYKDAMGHAMAYETIKASRGTHFDPDIVDVFLAQHMQWQAIAAQCQDEPIRRAAGTGAD